jgi:hypothetical protein
MRFLRVWVVGLIFTGIIGMGFLTSCTHARLEAVAPKAVPIATATPTSGGNTSTPTSSPTATATPTATISSLAILDDFKGTGGSGSDSVSFINMAQDENAHWRDGAWFVTNDVGVTTILSGTGTVDPTAIEQSVTFNPSGTSGFDQLGFAFTNPAGTHNAGITYYDATVGGRYTGIRFWGKVKTMPSTICGSSVPFWVDFVDNGAVTDHQVAVPFTTSWQQFTVYFNQAGWDQGEDGSSTALNPVSIQTVKFEPQNLGTNNFNIDFLIDGVQLTTTTAPAAPTAAPATLISDFADGANHVIFHNGSPFYAGTASPWSGYWYVFADNFGVGTTECPNGSVTGTTIFPDAPGNGGAQDFAGHVFGTVGAACGAPYTTCPFAGMGFNFLKPAGPYDASAWATPDLAHGIQFYAKWGPSSNAAGVFLKFVEMETATAAEGGNCVGGGVNGMGQTIKCDDHFCYELTTAQISTSWQPIQIPMTPPILATQGWGNMTPAWDPVSLIGVQWEFDNTFPGANYDLWVDDVSFY